MQSKEFSLKVGITEAKSPFINETFSIKFDSAQNLMDIVFSFLYQENE